MYTLFVEYTESLRLLYIALYTLNIHCYLQHIVRYIIASYPDTISLYIIVSLALSPIIPFPRPCDLAY